MAIPRPRVSTFRITSLEDGDLYFESYFGDGAPLVIDGYGGWSVHSRPREVGLTEWEGRNPMAIEIPFNLDNYSYDQGSDGDPTTESEPSPGIETESMVHNLEVLCGLGGHAQPPICRVNGHGIIPHDFDTNKRLKWVIESVSWDRDLEIRSGTSGRRLRCGGMITVRQFITNADLLRSLTSKSRARKPEIYIVKKGDTLAKIALKKYHNADMWKRIADANNIRDGRSLKPGMHLRIPR